MRVAVIGALGQLGTALSKSLTGEVIALGHDAIDITDPVKIETVLAEERPEAVINCAAYNLVDKAEDEPQTAFLVNALGPRNLALACAKLAVPLMHVSSDYVFGESVSRHRGFTESDLPTPQGAYAVSKLAGEFFVRAHCPQHYVVRTCGLYGHATTPGKGNFIKTMLRLGKERGEVSVVDDQWCTPSSALDVARGLAALLTKGRFGLYHVTNRGETTWCRLAMEAFRVAGLTVKVNPINTAQFNAKARRPPFSVLDCSYFTAVTGSELPVWQEAVAAYIQTL